MCTLKHTRQARSEAGRLMSGPTCLRYRLCQRSNVDLQAFPVFVLSPVRALPQGPAAVKPLTVRIVSRVSLTRVLLSLFLSAPLLHFPPPTTTTTTTILLPQHAYRFLLPICHAATGRV